MVLAHWAAGFCIFATSVQVVTTAIAAVRCRARTQPLPPPDEAALVSIVRPVCGVDNFARETLGSSFGLDYPDYEILFCVARGDDPVVALIDELIAAHPQQPARLLIGDDRVGPNPKLNNVVKGFDAARGRWQIMADSNVLMPRDYIQRLLARWRPNSGCVVSVPIGSRPANFWAELECAFLNTFQARWEYVSDTFGFGFAQGKNMLFRRDILEEIGGVRALGEDVAEDAATTKLVRGIGKSVHVMGSPFEQPLARRGRSVGPPSALVAAETDHLPAPLYARTSHRLPVSPDRRRLCRFMRGRQRRPGLRVAVGDLAGRGSDARALRRVAAIAETDSRDADPRPDAAGALGRRLAQRRGRVARQHRQRSKNAGFRVARSDGVPGLCFRAPAHQPPSTPIACPVTNPASSEAR
jgi:hypothetical protein